MLLQVFKTLRDAYKTRTKNEKGCEASQQMLDKLSISSLSVDHRDAIKPKRKTFCISGTAQKAIKTYFLIFSLLIEHDFNLKRDRNMNHYRFRVHISIRS